uniref:TNFR-Cys domain-containing protein n=1 Tax=Syphacia muris TaxID=451379 RepID=A0A0N5ALY7_9BILA
MEKCVWLKGCHQDSECGSGHCVGSLSKCDCAACKPLTPCKSDKECGGLRYSCDMTTKVCNCSRGIHDLHLYNGFKNIITGITHICVHTECKLNDPHSCFGLPCVQGICLCVPEPGLKNTILPIHYG